MGGAVSSGESNDDLIDNLLASDYIKSSLIERVFRGVDRAFYYTNPFKQNAYKDLAWKDGNLHLSAPCIYSEVLENINVEQGMSFLNVGSGTGYLSTIVGLILGRRGVNHGIELYDDVVEYARMKLDEFLRSSSAIDMFDFCVPQFVVGNGLEITSCPRRYDRIYCGAACPEASVQVIVDMLKIGGVCVVPINDSLVHITRISDSRIDMKTLLPVSFASLVVPVNVSTKPVCLPELNPMSLGELCRAEIRSILRKSIVPPPLKSNNEAGRRRRRRKRQERRRASRLLVVQRRRSGGEPDGDQNGFVAIAYSMGRNSRNRNRRNSNDEEGEAERDRSVVPVARRNSDHEMDDSSDEDFFDMSPLQDVEDRNDKSKTAESTEKCSTTKVESSLPCEADSSSSKPMVPNGHNNKSLPEKIDEHQKSDSNSANVASGSGSGRVSSTTGEVPSDSLPKIRAAPTQGGSRNGTGGLLNGHRTQRRAVWEQYCLSSPEINQMVNRRVGGAVSTDSRMEAASGNAVAQAPPSNNAMEQEQADPENMILSDSTSSDDEFDLDRNDFNYDVGQRFLQQQIDRSNARDEMSDSDEDQDNSEVEADDNTKTPNPYSVQMAEKIQSLPLPPALKMYLNYSRKF